MKFALILSLPFICVGIFVWIYLSFLSKKSHERSRIASVLSGVNRSGGQSLVTVFTKANIKAPRLMGTENMAYVIAAPIAIGLFICATVVLPAQGLEQYKTMGMLAAFMVFVFIPFFYKKMLREKRNDEVFRTLPVLIDLLIICFGAGLSFSASISRIMGEIQKKSPFLGEKFQMAVHELNAGVDKKTALQNLVERTGNQPAFKTFISSIIQSEIFGFSIVQTLEVQAQEVRLKKKQMLKTKMAQVPVKLLFPLIFFIFPVTFVLLVGPGFIRVLGSLQ